MLNVLSAASVAGLAAAACRPATAPWNAHAPVDAAVVFQSLLPGEPLVPVGTAESPWERFTEEGTSVERIPEGIQLKSVPGRRAWAAPRLPVAPLPGLGVTRTEELTWLASATLDRTFLIVCELRFAGEPGAILLQIAPTDLQVFHDADRPEGGRSESVPAVLGDGQEHAWRLRLNAAQLALKLDGSPVWTYEGQRRLARATFGETRSDGLHGGQLLVHDVVYVRRPA